MRGRRAGAEALLGRPLLVAAVIALLLGLPILLLGELSASDTRDRLRAQRYAANGALAERAADLVASRVLALEAQLLAAATESPLARATDLRRDAEGASSLLRDLYPAMRRDVRSVHVLDAFGQGFAVEPFDARFAEKSFANFGYYLDVTPAGGRHRSHISGAYERDGLPTVTVSAGLRAGDLRSPRSATFAGVLAADLRLEAVKDWVAPLADSAERIYLFDAKGSLIASVGVIGEPLRDLSRTAVVKAALAGRRVSGDEQDPLGAGLRSIANAPVPGAGWHVVIARSAEGVDPELDAALGQLLAVRIALVALLVLGGYALSRALSQAIRSRRLVTESLEQQTAVSEVLKVISGSPFDLQPVLDTVIYNAVRLCNAEWGIIFRADGDTLHLVTSSGQARAAFVDFVTQHPLPVDPTTVSGRAALERRTVHVPDVLADPEFPDYRTSEGQRLGGFRAVLSVPLVREGTLIGVIAVDRNRARPFSPREIVLLETFADQAVIAIENVRLFNETKEALERQTATGEILRVISGSPTDIQPVLDAIAENAARFCAAEDTTVWLIQDDVLRLRAHYGPQETLGKDLPISATSVSGHAVIERRTVQISDQQAVADRYPSGAAFSHTARAVLATPLQLQGRPLGVLTLRRTAAGAYTERQVELAETFASQAVIAIENVRLFNETREALERQTAIGEILRVISSSPSDLQPVFEAIAHSAARYCAAEDAIVLLSRGGQLHVAAHHGPLPANEPDFPVDRRTVSGRAVVERQTMHVADLLAEPEEEYPLGKAQARRHGHRTVLVTPLLREGQALGALLLRRNEVRPFGEKQIELLQTFADQAVIAMENVRLFNETKEALEQQTATADLLKVISTSKFELQPVFDAVALNAVQLCEADNASMIFWRDSGTYRYIANAGDFPDAGAFTASWEGFRVRPGRGTLTGRLLLERRSVQIEDIDADPEYERAAQKAVGTKTHLAVPLMRDGEPIGAIIARRFTVRPFTEKQVKLLETFAAQAVIAIENVRLFDEIEDKSRQLEAANRHKSEFLANMSHELRTPLNAIIGFSEVMLQAMFGKLNAKQSEYTQDILSSGRHLLTLINDILDLSKIEAGRMELELGEFSLRAALSNGVTMVRERATDHGIRLELDLSPDVDVVVADERKVKQVVYNLLSNAVKFTPDGGRVAVHAERSDGEVRVAVQDTGIGIHEDERDSIFEEFRQSHRAPDKSREGTGLGLTLSKKFVELHGGRIWVESAVGKGSTFTFTLPLRGR